MRHGKDLCCFAVAGWWVLAGCGPDAATPQGTEATGSGSGSSSEAEVTTGQGSTDETTTTTTTTAAESSGGEGPTCGLPELAGLQTATGPHGVSMLQLALEDASRATPPNGEFEGSPVRELPTTVWFPTDGDEPAPLVVYSHGLSSASANAAYLAQRWASYGYVVAAPDFPLSNAMAPGGPTVTDVVGQRDDVAFVIEEVISASQDDASALSGLVDPDRVAVTGLSLGALTSLLLLADPPSNVKAAVLLGTPACFLEGDLFGPAPIPTIAIHGDADMITPFDEHALRLLDGTPPDVYVVRLWGGTHTAFAALAQPGGESFDNPDEFGCNNGLDLTGLYTTLAETLGGDTLGCTQPCTQPMPWPEGIDFPTQLSATAAISLVHLERTLRGCSDAEQLWSILRSGVEGMDVLPEP